MIGQRYKKLLGNKYVIPVKNLLLQGISPNAIALAIAGALAISLFPVIGSTTILCALFALRFRLNLPLIQIINYSMFPIQIIMLFPWMKLGAFIFRYEKLKYTLNEILTMISTDTLHAISVLWYVTLQAIGAWILITPIITYAIYLLFVKIIETFSKHLPES